MTLHGRIRSKSAWTGNEDSEDNLDQFYFEMKSTSGNLLTKSKIFDTYIKLLIVF